MNLKGMASLEDTLHEWFGAIEMPKRLYAEFQGKEKKEKKSVSQN